MSDKVSELIEVDSEGASLEIYFRRGTLYMQVIGKSAFCLTKYRVEKLIAVLLDLKGKIL